MASHLGVLPGSVVMLLNTNSTVALRVIVLHTIGLIREYIEYNDIMHIVGLFL